MCCRRCSILNPAAGFIPIDHYHITCRCCLLPVGRCISHHLYVAAAQTVSTCLLSGREAVTLGKSPSREPLPPYHVTSAFTIVPVAFRPASDCPTPQKLMRSQRFTEHDLVFQQDQDGKKQDGRFLLRNQAVCYRRSLTCRPGHARHDSNRARGHWRDYASRGDRSKSLHSG